jgi:RimJ/RimL family protein N-acetyltransferase
VLHIRPIHPDDSEKLVNLILQVERESDFMLFEAGERKLSPEQQRRRMEAMVKEENSTILVAEVDDNLIGYLIAIGGVARRNQHSVYLVVGILEQYRGKGVGTRLFMELENWAREHHIHRLELTVMTNNQAAISLYSKMGFEKEGIKRDSLLVNGEYVDEYYMAKLV